MLKKVCNTISTIILIFLVVIGGLLLVPQLVGYKTFVIVSGSMEPNIPVGSLVYAKEVPFDEIQVDDIVSYQISSSTTVTHRVAEINQDVQEVVTKGDANDVVDANPVSYSHIIGKVAFSIPILGSISLYMRSIIGVISIICLLIILFLLEYLPDKLNKK